MTRRHDVDDDNCPFEEGADPSADAPARATHRERRRNRKVLVAALVLLLVPLLAGGGYLAMLNHIVSRNVKREDLLRAPGAAAPSRRSRRATAPTP